MSPIRATSRPTARTSSGAAFDSLRRLHRLLAERSFYPLLLASALACGLLALRMMRLHNWDYRGFVWNLILAWVPYAASLWVARTRLGRPGRPWLLLLPGLIWLAFLPNAPYLVTDFIHIRPRPEMPWLYWYDLVMMAVFAWTGCVLGAVSLGMMQRAVAEQFNRLVGWLFVLGAAGLCGIGVYLGRFGRWNSWDVLLNPRALGADLLAPLRDPTAYLRPLALCALFAAFFLVSYLTLAGRVGAPRQGAEE